MAVEAEIALQRTEQFYDKVNKVKRYQEIVAGEKFKAAKLLRDITEDLFNTFMLAALLSSQASRNPLKKTKKIRPQTFHKRKKKKLTQ